MGPRERAPVVSDEQMVTVRLPRSHWRQIESDIENMCGTDSSEIEILSQAQVTEDSADPMPVFTIKAKDRLASAAILAYYDLCVVSGLASQATEVSKALRETRHWQARHRDEVQMPDHRHLPVTGQPTDG
jgi:hypothetical protein